MRDGTDYAAPSHVVNARSANDDIALGAMDAARGTGVRVPDALAITGWGDIPMTRGVSPALSRCSTPVDPAALLDERITTD